MRNHRVRFRAAGELSHGKRWVSSAYGLPFFTALLAVV